MGERAKVATIYRILNSVTGKSYVGSSEDTHFRWRKHREMLVRGGHHSTKLQRSWNKHGPDVWTWSILEEVSSEQLLAREQFHIDRLNACGSGYNMSAVAGRVVFTEAMKAAIAEANRQRHWTPESRARVSAAAKGNSYAKGKVPTPEARMKMSIAGKGRVKSLETRARMSAAQKGRTFSAESLRKMSEAKKGRPRATRSQAQ